MEREQLLEFIKQRAYDTYGTNANRRDLFDDLVEVFKLDPTDPITTRMYSNAWESGHSYGVGEVFNHFEDLVYVFRG
jgi:hypothetical protein